LQAERSVTKPPCSLDLTKFKRTSPRPDGTEIVAFGGDCQQPTAPERHAQSRRIPEWLIEMTDLAIGK
jgi:hypothetical protein